MIKPFDIRKKKVFKIALQQESLILAKKTVDIHVEREYISQEESVEMHKYLEEMFNDRKVPENCLNVEECMDLLRQYVKEREYDKARGIARFLHLKKVNIPGLK